MSADLERDFRVSERRAMLAALREQRHHEMTTGPARSVKPYAPFPDHQARTLAEVADDRRILARLRGALR